MKGLWHENCVKLHAIFDEAAEGGKIYAVIESPDHLLGHVASRGRGFKVLRCFKQQSGHKQEPDVLLLKACAWRASHGVGR